MRNNVIVEACDDAEESDKSGYEEGENSMFQDQLSFQVPEVKPKAFNVEHQLKELLDKRPAKPAHNTKHKAARETSPYDNSLGDLADVDLNKMDDAALLENFENVLVDNIKLEGGELQIDFNINIDVPDYLNFSLQNDDINNSIASIIQFSQPPQLGDRKRTGGSAQSQLDKLKS